MAVGGSVSDTAAVLCGAGRKDSGLSLFSSCSNSTIGRRTWQQLQHGSSCKLDQSNLLAYPLNSEQRQVSAKEWETHWSLNGIPGHAGSVVNNGSKLSTYCLAVIIKYHRQQQPPGSNILTHLSAITAAPCPPSPGPLALTWPKRCWHGSMQPPLNPTTQLL